VVELQVAPSCIAVGHMTDPSALSAHTASDDNRIYDLTLQAPWMEDPGGRWVAGASSLGNIVLWDTTTWREMYCSKATNGSIYSCCSLPGSNMVAVACPSPQLVQVYDCRQAPDNIAAVMTCDMPPRTAGGSASIGVCLLPSEHGSFLHRTYSQDSLLFEPKLNHHFHFKYSLVKCSDQQVDTTYVEWN
jgi:WD40 repeat protein